MKIAIMLGGTGFDSQRRTINGILDKALLDRANIYIFTCEGWKYEFPSEYEKGEYNVYTLPDFTQYDGVILNSDTIHDENVVNDVRHKIMEAGIPCVDLNVHNHQAMIVEMENRKGIEEIIWHLIREHYARNIYFISGPMTSHDACVRLEAYKSTMATSHIGWDNDHIYYGDYSYGSGKRAVQKFLSKARSVPDAIVAANDEMAVGAILALREAGYLVPEDVMVTGYDDSSIASYCYPRLTTVRRGEYEAGQIAYDKIVEALRGKTPEQHTVIRGCPVLAGSCGCKVVEGYDDTAILRDSFVENYVRSSQDMETIKNSSAEFTGLVDFEDLLRRLERYIRDINIEYFYLCMCDSIENYYEELDRIAEGKARGRDATIYSDKIEVPFAFEKGEINSYGSFHRSLLLPEECEMKRSGAFFTIMPLHFQDYCFGYCVAGNYRPSFEGRFYQNFVLNLDNALETVRKQDMMKAMLQRLNRMWVCDALTGIYNRAGFNKFAPQLMEEACKNGEAAGAIFADVDGLKRVNDTYGHKQGDVLIRAMASVMGQALHSGEILCRFGGDEFVIFMTGYKEDEVSAEVKRIQTAINNYNMLHNRPYKLSASLGYHWVENAGTTSLDELVKNADEEMYRVKRAKKAKRQEEEEKETIPETIEEILARAEGEGD